MRIKDLRNGSVKDPEIIRQAFKEMMELPVKKMYKDKLYSTDPDHKGQPYRDYCLERLGDFLFMENLSTFGDICLDLTRCGDYIDSGGPDPQDKENLRNTMIYLSRIYSGFVIDTYKDLRKGDSKNEN